jgi:phosphoribosylanthranilate isomerase
MRDDLETLGTGFDLQMMNCYFEYREMITALTDEWIVEMGLNIDIFSGILENLSCLHDDSAASLLQMLDTADSFIEFALMMESEYFRIYSIDRERRIEAPVSSGSSSSVVAGQHQMCVRILWDIENVSVSKSQGGLKTVSNLREFLKSKNLLGAGIDTRITAFFNPSQRSVSDRVVQELDKAGVELIWVSTKREDADRKLSMRVSQEMQVLNPTLSTFVIISSDQDFRSQMQLLESTGFRVIVIHQCKTEAWRAAMEMHCSEAFEWSAVVGLDESNVADDSTEARQIVTRRVVDLKELCIGWLTGVCIRWKTLYGFISLNPVALRDLLNSFDKTVIVNHAYYAHLPEDFRAQFERGQLQALDIEHSANVDLRVYAHHKALDDSFRITRPDKNSEDLSTSSSAEKVEGKVQHYLSKGEVVALQVVLGSRGLRALSVKPISSLNV